VDRFGEHLIEVVIGHRRGCFSCSWPCFGCLWVSLRETPTNTHLG
jgi:hypothetical protein